MMKSPERRKRRKNNHHRQNPNINSLQQNENSFEKRNTFALTKTMGKQNNQIQQSK